MPIQGISGAHFSHALLGFFIKMGLGCMRVWALLRLQNHTTYCAGLYALHCFSRGHATRATAHLSSIHQGKMHLIPIQIYGVLQDHSQMMSVVSGGGREYH